MDLKGIHIILKEKPILKMSYLFKTRKEALEFLDNNALNCVGWHNKHGSMMCAIYWNGRLKTEKVNKNDEKSFKVYSK